MKKIVIFSLLLSFAIVIVFSCKKKEEEAPTEDQDPLEEDLPF